MDRRFPRALRRPSQTVFAALLAMALAACSSSVPEHQVREDFATLQQTGAIPARARLERIELQNGGNDGAEIEVYFCLPAAEGPAHGCEPRNAGLSYQKLGERWQLFSVEAEQLVQ